MLLTNFKLHPVSDKSLGTRATAAAAAGDLPDVIYHTLQYVLPWVEAGILDVDANNAVVKELGKKNFCARRFKYG
jgi:multiple sugar transport system substrate-binding protein